MREEKIMCAAVLHDGVFYQGLSHATAILLAFNVSEIRPEPTGDFQGFWTNFNRYVDRIEAMRIAVDANQVSRENGIDITTGMWKPLSSGQI